MHLDSLGQSRGLPVHPEVERVARFVAGDAVARGAEAVVLVGSHARGEAHPESDIDLHIIGDGPQYVLARHEPFLVSISWRTAEQHREAFFDPLQAGGALPAWRNAVIFHDSGEVAASLQREAVAWTWDMIGSQRLDEVVADGIYGYAEEVHKLVAHRDVGRRSTAAVQRSILALRLAIYLAVHHRILYDTENRLWDLVNAAMGDTWTHAQSAALGLNDETFRETCDAAVTLFALACREVWPLFDDRQRAVVEHACRGVGNGEWGTGNGK